MDNYSKGINVSASADAAYAAITQGMQHWWTEASAAFNKVGDEATFVFKPNPTAWTFRATKLEPAQYAELECIDANHVHEGLPESIAKEWLGTKLIFEIKPDTQGSFIKFTHEGLNASLDCHEICVGGWDYFIAESLKKYLESAESS
jgi:hypothetical protein